MNIREEKSPTGRCGKVLLVQAEFDRELDAAQAANLQAHRTHCADCQAAEVELTRAHALLREEPYRPMPEAMRQRILARLDADRATPVLGPAEGWIQVPATLAVLSRFRSSRQSAIGFGVGVACAAALAFLVLAPTEQNLTEQLVAAHVRALQPGHLEDVVSTDQHTVKPWFDGRIDFAPPVKDFAAGGFPLIGGRLDYIDGRPVAALVYRHDRHIIDLYVWPGAANAISNPAVADRNGYSIVHWTQDGMTFWAVSDVDPGELRAFTAAWQETS